MTAIYHITSVRELEEAHTRGEYLPQAFAADGFIHCSYAHQLTTIANALFRGRTDLVVLEIERARVPSDILDENLSGGAELFPHIYGSLPLSAITRVIRFPCRGDGLFDLPAGVPV
jgi:uncharacterized protein (DUF952 family)